MKKNEPKNRGVLLIEVLIAIALFMAISTIIAQALFTSFYGGKISQEKSIMNGLIQEQFVKIRAISVEHWDNVGGLTMGSDYHIENSSSTFFISPGKYSGVVDEIPYTISFKINNASRTFESTSTPLSITSVLPTVLDNGTLIITASASWRNNEPIVMQSIITRFRNVICAQQNWSATNSPASIPCETGNISASSKNNIEAGDQLKLCNGCN